MSDATSMAEDFASGRSDPVHVLEQALDKASRAPAVFISLTAARWRAGQPLSVFDGVPLAWKDLFDVAGSITTAGAAFRRHAPAALLDAPSVGLLCRAGMVSVGKTNLSELAHSLDSLGPLTRSVRDALVIDDLLHGRRLEAARTLPASQLIHLTDACRRLQQQLVGLLLSAPSGEDARLLRAALSVETALIV
ncbi:hypothetical protein PsexTeo8_10780 [Pseudomonas extremaustralis]|uniref:amidase family protein n=1 Tax=Pseudomonas extremaustralis TaxID=359110 RepID=UPI002AA0BF75|nr:amidase family protein [Pseudomonas extremaustralis]MDY7064660.1 hypothetical protein [Pseudomonas extremaustralis]